MPVAAAPVLRPADPPTRARPSLRGSPWRLPLAAAALVAAAAHVPVTGEHLQEALYIGVLFLLLEVACVACAVVVLLAPSRPVLASIALVGGLAVAAFVISRTAGLPLIGDDVGRWTEPLAVVSVAAEAVMAVGGLLALGPASRATSRGRSVGAVAGAAIVAGGALAIGLALAGTDTAAEEGGHDSTGHGTSGHEMSGHDMSGMDMTAP